MMREWLESAMFWNKSMFSIKTKMIGSSYLHTQEINITFKSVGESILLLWMLFPFRINLLNLYETIVLTNINALYTVK